MARPGSASCTLAAVLSALLVALPASAASRAVPSRSVLLYGDSLAVGTGLFLPAYLHGWSISQSTSVSRHAYEAPAALSAARATLPRVIAVSLGTNDDPSAVGSFGRSVRDVIRAAGPARCVIWSTIVRPPYNGVSYDGYNAVLRRYARRYASFHVLDWQAMARANPQWFGSDGVHPTFTGYRALAGALAKLVKSCARP